MRKDRSLWLLILLVIASFALISIDRTDLKEAGFIKGEIRDLTSIFSGKGSSTLRKLSIRLDRYFEILKTKNKSIALKQKVEELEQELIDLNEVKMEYERHAELLKFQKHIRSTRDIRTIAAGIINAELTNWQKTLLVNRGKKDGVTLGSAVIAGRVLEDRLVGRVVGSIFHVGIDTSVILLLTDQRSSIGAVIQGNRVHGIVKGSLSDSCTIDDISNTADVVEGDIVLSSGIGETFPSGLAIGEISSVEKRENDFFQEIIVTPFIDISRLEEVLILRGK